MRRPEYEQLPTTLPNKQFPVGDVTDPNLRQMADNWFATVGEYDIDRFDNYIRYASKPKPHHGEEGARTHDAALKFCQDVNYWRGDGGMERMTWGYMIARAFQDETCLLPGFRIDLAGELKEMNTGNYEATVKARQFGRAAWTGMEHSHPHVFTQFKRLLEFSRKTFQLDMDDGEEYFVAGMMLPYMFACASYLDARMQDAGYMEPDTPDEQG